MFIRNQADLPSLYPMKICGTLLVVPDSSPPSRKDLAYRFSGLKCITKAPDDVRYPLLFFHYLPMIAFNLIGEIVILYS